MGCAMLSIRDRTHNQRFPIAHALITRGDSEFPIPRYDRPVNLPQVTTAHVAVAHDFAYGFTTAAGFNDRAADRPHPAGPHSSTWR